MFKRHFVLAALSASVAFGATNALAESTQVNGGGALNAGARLDFQVTIPGVLRFRIGTAGATIDQIAFNVPAANVGDGTDVAGTGGDASGGTAMNVELFGNRGQITVTPVLSGANLTNGTGGVMPYSEILTAATTGDGGGGGSTSGANLSVTTPLTPVPNVNASVTNRTDIWTFTYDNTTAYPAGTYGGVDTQGSRVTWTASMP